VKAPEPFVVAVSQPGVKDPSPWTMLPSGRMIGTSYGVDGARPLPPTMTISSGA